MGKVAQEVVVTAEIAGVSLNSPEHSTLITAADISRLSTTGRNTLELVSMLPGFSLNAGTGLNNAGPDYTTTSFGSGNLGSFGANGLLPSKGLSALPQTEPRSSIRATALVLRFDHHMCLWFLHRGTTPRQRFFQDVVHLRWLL